MGSEIQDPINWDEVGRRNRDLGDRLTDLGLTLTYDEDGDTLLVSIGDGGDTLTEQVLDEVFVRIHPDTLKIQGFVVLGFEAEFLGQNRIFRRALRGLFDKIRNGGGTMTLEGREAQRAEPYFEAAIASR